MGVRSLNQLKALRVFVTGARKIWLSLRSGVLIDSSASISLSSTLLPGRRNAIVIGPETLVAFKTLLYATDGRVGEVRPIRIGRRCFIGGGSIITPGVTVGDESIVAAGSVVFDDVPPRSIVAGNPARVLRTDIKVGRFGRLEGADDNSRRMWNAD